MLWLVVLVDQVTDVIIVLNSKSALQAFASSAQVSSTAQPDYLPTTFLPRCLSCRRSTSWRRAADASSRGVVYTYCGGWSMLVLVMTLPQVSLGTELSVSLGPLGRTAATDVHAGDKGVSAAFSYAHSKVRR